MLAIQGIKGKGMTLI